LKNIFNVHVKTVAFGLQPMLHQCKKFYRMQCLGSVSLLSLCVYIMISMATALGL
jgi:hypothetical protein